MFNSRRTDVGNFERCPLKKVTVETTYGYNAILECPTTNSTGGVKSGGKRVGNGERANTSALMAIKSLGIIASEIACNSCPLVGLSPTEANAQLSEEAAARATLIEAQAREERARKGLEAATSHRPGDLDPRDFGA